MRDLRGRVAFITGGSRGIGLGIARACAEAGVKIAIADLDEASLTAAAAELSELTDVQAHRLDVSDREAYASVAKHVQEGLGEVSLLFNNAGVADSVSPSGISHDVYAWMRGINVDGVHHGLEQFLPGMVARRDGHILSTASEAGIIPEGGGYLYSLSKYAVVGLSESLRVELGPLGIGVTVLIPGPCATTIVENTRHHRPETAPKHSERTSQILTMAHEWLTTQGRSPDDVGALAVEAIRENRPYVFTRDEGGAALTARTQAMLEAMRHDHDHLEARASEREAVSR
ncbi:MAG: hypothetical protein QOI20_2271 [Acidimicrobiaceae bacterium]|nr:hypothetical protein [Acidimicrobiaceae bacterium]